jgi:hypothetical protein
MNIKFCLILDSCNKNNDVEPDFKKYQKCDFKDSIDFEINHARTYYFDTCYANFQEKMQLYVVYTQKKKK